MKTTAQALSQIPDSARDLLARVQERLRAQIRGKDDMIELAMAAFLGRGHLLLEGPPGTGKTSLAKAMAVAFGGTFRRIQMTSDLLPSDVVGTLRLRPGDQEFEFRPGPVFANFLIADELNRTSPKTQSALLEAMAEGTVSVDGRTHPLPDPFFVVATQNPAESHGVYPLAESQLDRFMLKLEFDSPQKKDELEIYRNARGEPPAPRAPLDAHAGQANLTVAHDEGALQLPREAAKVFIEETMLEYVADLARATRARAEIVHGVSIRGGLQLISAAKALAFLRGRDFVVPQDVSDLAVPAIAHRLIFADGESDPARAETFVREILERVRPPR